MIAHIVLAGLEDTVAHGDEALGVEAFRVRLEAMDDLISTQRAFMYPDEGDPQRARHRGAVVFIHCEKLTVPPVLGGQVDGQARRRTELQGLRAHFGPVLVNPRLSSVIDVDEVMPPPRGGQRGPSQIIGPMGRCTEGRGSCPAGRRP